MTKQAIMPTSDGSGTLQGVPDPHVVSMIEGIARGEAGALASFYDEWFDRGYDMACTLTRRDESFCLDVVQESMLKVIRSLRPSLGILTRRSLDAWFSRVGHTTAIDLLRRDSRRARRERRGARHDAAGAAPDAALLDEQIAWVAGELAALDHQDAALVAARFGQDRTLEAAGAAEGMTTGAAHGRLRRLLDRVRRAGKEKFDE
jgi:DNA-directed RNA polymerase specialized sigma24 family protein